MVNSNLFLREDVRKGLRKRKRGRETQKRKGEREESLRRETLHKSNNWSFQFLALRLTPDASLPIAVRLVRPVYNARMYLRMCVSQRVRGLRHQHHILNANMPGSINRLVNRVTRSRVGANERRGANVRVLCACGRLCVFVNIYVALESDDVTSVHGVTAVKESIFMRRKDEPASKFKSMF